MSDSGTEMVVLSWLHLQNGAKGLCQMQTQ